MEDFELSDCFYRLEEDISLHPAYLFRMSARDMARFGQLYLQNGKWNNKQLIPSDWIHQSTQAISTDLENFSDREAYGYLWWVSSIDDQKMYSASGSGGHKIIVLPESDMVIVHRVNSYENKIVEEKNINAIVSQILNAQLSKKQKSNPTLIPYSPVLKKFSTKYLGSMDKYLGTYKHRVLGEMTIQKSAKKYELKNGVGVFELFPQSESSFAPEDLESLIEMKEAKSEKQRYSIEPNFSPDGSLISVVFYYLP